MSEQSKRFWRGGARAATGVLIIGVSVGVAAAIGTGLVPEYGIERGVVSTEVDTSQNSQFSLVCTGSFAELGAEPSRPSASVPSGDSLLVVAGETVSDTELRREIDGGSAPRALGASAGASLAAAEVQQVLTPTLQGLASSACVEPVHDQWLVGGATGLGVSTTLVLGNPFEVAATVQITVYDAEGRVDAASVSGVLVQPGSQQIVSLNGYAPARDRLAVKVESTGAAVSAALGVSQVVDIRSYAVDSVTRQLSPSLTLVFAGVDNISESESSAVGSVETEDDFPVVVRLLAPGGEQGSARLRALSPDGASTDLGTVEFENSQVAEFIVSQWPESAEAIVVDSDAPVVGGVFGSADVAPSHDYAWFAPSPLLPTDKEIAVSITPGGLLVLANPGESDATVQFTPSDGAGEPFEVTLRAGAATAVEAQGQIMIMSDTPISAGVRIVNGAHITGYPVLAPADVDSTLTVYPR